jgi:4-diphosphocytidyl-2-C-methyl-D-erythritol kinase
MIVKANAKVNFTLEVLGKRSDGYHDLRSVVVPVSLADEIELVPAEKTVLEIADEKGFLRGVDCGGEKNLAVKAVRLMQQRSESKKKSPLRSSKTFPAAAGLAEVRRTPPP